MIEVSEFVMTRSVVAEEFHCVRCNQGKKAKAKATRQNSDDTTDIICNGCYGNIRSTGVWR